MTTDSQTTHTPSINITNTNPAKLLNDYVLTLACPDQAGIVYHVSGFLFQCGCNIVDSAQFGDSNTGQFFMRVHFTHQSTDLTQLMLHQAFTPIAQKFNMTWQIHAQQHRARLLIMVSKQGHCLNDLLFRVHQQHLHADIVAIVSNHTDFAELADRYHIPFHHLPINANNKAQQESVILQLIEQEQIDVVVLARYMQVLSHDFCQRTLGKVINIHHSFLPSFKGAKPYHQAHERGVKLIGATAHYVTSDLDEGPIIEQDVHRVEHQMTAADLTAQGQDVECLVLARALKWHIEHRILLNSHKTIIFK
jgi:formyltetrahydrofolate deformylase